MEIMRFVRLEGHRLTDIVDRASQMYSTGTLYHIPDEIDAQSPAHMAMGVNSLHIAPRIIDVHPINTYRPIGIIGDEIWISP